MPGARALLLVTMQPMIADEEEFNDWYDTEHIPERVSIDGFLTAARYVCTAGWPRYMAMYDLANLEVLRSGAYSAVAGEQSSPWSKRILRRVQGLYRFQGLQLEPDGAVEDSQQSIGWLTMLRFRGSGVDIRDEILKGLRETSKGNPGSRQARLFRSSDSHDYIALITPQSPGESVYSDFAAFGTASNCLDVVNHYRRY